MQPALPLGTPLREGRSVFWPFFPLCGLYLVTKNRAYTTICHKAFQVFAEEFVSRLKLKARFLKENGLVLADDWLMPIPSVLP